LFTLNPQSSSLESVLWIPNLTGIQTPYLNQFGERRQTHYARWLIGGRMRPGETVQSSIIRLLQRELQFKVDDPGRFKTVSHYTYCFDTRKEPPKEHGLADLAVILMIEVTAEEAAHIGTNFDQEEYSEFRWVHPEDLIEDRWDEHSGGIKFHPALKRASLDLLSMWQWETIAKLTEEREKISSNGGDCSSLNNEIATLVTSLVSKSHYKTSQKTQI
jgi:isopentenyldiphosphate isomerase